MASTSDVFFVHGPISPDVAMELIEKGNILCGSG